MHRPRPLKAVTLWSHTYTPFRPFVKKHSLSLDASIVFCSYASSNRKIHTHTESCSTLSVYVCYFFLLNFCYPYLNVCMSIEHWRCWHTQTHIHVLQYNYTHGWMYDFVRKPSFWRNNERNHLMECPESDWLLMLLLFLLLLTGFARSCTQIQTHGAERARYRTASTAQMNTRMDRQTERMSLCLSHPRKHKCCDALLAGWLCLYCCVGAWHVLHTDRANHPSALPHSFQHESVHIDTKAFVLSYVYIHARALSSDGWDEPPQSDSNFHFIAAMHFHNSL